MPLEIPLTYWSLKPWNLIKSTQNIHQWLIVHVLRHGLYEIQMKKIRKMFSLALIDYTYVNCWHWTYNKIDIDIKDKSLLLGQG